MGKKLVGIIWRGDVGREFRETELGLGDNCRFVKNKMPWELSGNSEGDTGDHSY